VGTCVLEGHITNIFRDEKDMVSPLPGHKSIFTPILKEKKIDLSREEF
jgi:hypothetical protein